MVAMVFIAWSLDYLRQFTGMWLSLALGRGTLLGYGNCYIKIIIIIYVQHNK